MNACMKPTMVTCPAAFNEAGSKMGRIAIELLVVTKFPNFGPLLAVIFAGPVPASRSSTTIVSAEGEWSRHCMPL